MTRGRYQLQQIDGAWGDLRGAQSLRHLAFRGGEGVESDAHDALCQHILISGADGPLATFRFRLMQGAQVEQSYSAQFYDLTPLSLFGGVVLELGRFCLHPQAHDPALLRLCWGALTQVVDGAGVGLMIGCSSFRGAETGPHLAALSRLAPRIAPPQWKVGRRAAQVIALPPDIGAEGGEIPALLKTYLAMGGWVSDHAVIDPAMDTIHVFTGVEVGRVPPARARALRAIAAEMAAIDVG